MNIEERLQAIRDAMDLLDSIQVERGENLLGIWFQAWSTNRYTIQYWSYREPNLLCHFVGEATERDMQNMMREALCRAKVEGMPVNLRLVEMVIPPNEYRWAADLETVKETE